MKTCDECLTAAYDAGARDYQAMIDLCASAGESLADHSCEKPGKCGCSCQK